MRRALPAVVITFALMTATASFAQPLPHESDRPTRRNALIPLIEVPLINIGMSTFNRFVFREDWTVVTPETILRNLRGGWSFDDNGFEINTIGHPYQGSMYFNAARSGGLTFWEGMLSAFLGSLLWEIAGESEAPSINDQIITTAGGSFLGEALHRTSLALLYAPGSAPTWLRLSGAVLANPVGMLNRGMFDGHYEPLDGIDEMPVLARFSAGVNALGFVASKRGELRLAQQLGDEAHIDAELRAGLPGVRGYRPRAPFDHFDVQAEASLSKDPSGSLFVTGLIAGRAFELGRTGAGVWGLFGNFDWADHGVLRVSTVSAGPGASLGVDLTHTVQLQAMLVLSGVGLGAVGALPNPAPQARDYHFGPGAQLFAELTAVDRDLGSIHLGLRQYVVTGAYVEPGTESMTYFTAGLRLALSRHFELLTEVMVSARDAQYNAGRDDFWQRATQARIGVIYLTEPGHGATRRPLPELPP